MSSNPSSSTNSRIKRKPPPSFPYSPRFPEPDPSDPFVPLNVLRARAQASAPSLTYPSSTDSHGSVDVRKTHYLMTPERTQDSSVANISRSVDHEHQQRPWYGLAAGYLSEVSKPLRPPRSRKRPGTGRSDTTYVSDGDVQVTSPPPPAQRAVRQPHRALTTPEATPRERKVSVQRHESQKQSRRRSQSVILPAAKRASTLPSPYLKANASESAQDALSYGDRQSHGYAYTDFGQHGQETSTLSDSLRSRAESDASTQSETLSSHGSLPSRHPTPPMTPDDTVSSASAGGSPLPDHVFTQAASSQPLLLDHVVDVESKPLPIPKDDVVLRTNRNTIVANEDNRETIVAEKAAPTSRRTIYASDFPEILTPPPPVPPIPGMRPDPSSVPETPMGSSNEWANMLLPSPTAPAPPAPAQRKAPANQTTARSTVRYVDSDPETHTTDRRRRTSSLDQFRKKLQKSSNNGSSIRGKISGPMPLPSAAVRRPSTADSGTSALGSSSDNAPRPSTTAPTMVKGLVGGMKLKSAVGLDVPTDAVALDDQLQPDGLKPKKSLSHVNLGLRPLPNASLAPTIAPSANTSTASALGNLSLMKPREETSGPRTGELLRAQTASVAAARADRRSVGDVQRAYTTVPRVERVSEASTKHTVAATTASTRRPFKPVQPPAPVAPTAPPQRDSESEEDLATYSILTSFNLVLSPMIPLASSTPAWLAGSGVESETPSPVAIEDVRPALAAPQPTRRTMALPAPPPRSGSDQSAHRASTAPPPRPESPVRRVASPVPVPVLPRVENPPPPMLTRHRAPPQLTIVPPPRAKSPVPVQPPSNSQLFQRPTESPEPILPPSRSMTTAPIPIPMKSRVQDVIQTHNSNDDERSSQRSRGSRGSKTSREREETGYLPVAQLPTRPSVSRQQTAQSHASSRRSVASKGTSTHLATVQQSQPISIANRDTIPTTKPSPPPARAETVPQPRPRDLNRPTSPPPASTLAPPPPQNAHTRGHGHGHARARSPEQTATTRSAVKVRTAVRKDMDSPLPPPPVEMAQVQRTQIQMSPLPPPPVESRSTPSDLRAQSRAATLPEVTSPLVFASSQLSSPDANASRRHNTAPLGRTPEVDSLNYTTRSQPTDLYEHGRSCSHHSQSMTNSRRGHLYPPANFDEHAMPSREQLNEAGKLYVVAQNGVRVPFGDLFRDRKVIVIFIRHFWCHQCQDYMYSISKMVREDDLRRSQVSLVVIGNGSHGMIKSYRNIFHTPFALYTDPSLQVHEALGMTYRTNDPGPESERGEYTHHGMIGGLAMVVRNALRVGMPVFQNGGDVTALGGEFVLGPGLSCTFAHRMRTTRGHAAIQDVLDAAGVRPQAPHSHSLPHYIHEEDYWPARSYNDMGTLGSSSRRDVGSTRDRRGGERERVCMECGPGASEPAYEYASANQRFVDLSPNQDARVVTVRHRDEGEDADNETEEDRTRLTVRTQPRVRTRSNNLKKGVRSYRVANPDRERDRRRPPPQRGESYEKHDLWSPPAAAMDEFGRKHEHDAAYMLTHEVLSYTFGHD